MSKIEKKELKVCTSGIYINGCDHVDITSTASLLGHDILVWHQKNTFEENIKKRGVQGGLYVVPSEELGPILKSFERRRAEIEKHLMAGKLLVIIPSEELKVRNSFSGQMVSVQYNNFLPSDAHFFFKLSSGDKIEPITKNPLLSDLNELLVLKGFYYGTVTGKQSCNLVASIRDHAEDVVAIFFKALNGWVLVIPDVQNDSKLVLADVLKGLYIALKQDKKLAELPDYAKKIVFSEESQKLKVIEEKKLQIQAIENQIESVQKENIKFDYYRTLIGGTGESLRLAVSELFKSINFVVNDVDSRKEDLVISFEKQVGAVEVKGKTKSAATKDRRQLDDWVLAYENAYDLVPKGILIVNGYYDLEMEKRTEQVFPDEMLEVSVQKKYCLITTVQLLAEVLAIKNGSQTVQEFSQRLFSAEGRFQSKFTIPVQLCG